MKKDVILTGLRANSEFHIGNYLGSILPVIQLQKQYAGEYQINMFVPDLHSFTTPIDHDRLYHQTINNLKTFIAAGLEINNPDTFLYRQSFIPAHSELTWILDCFTGMGELERMTQFKEKSNADTEHVTAGLFNYPVLMAADILLYGAKYVPVGDDQRQHLELTRDLAMRLNNKFGQDLFVVPVDWAAQLAFTKREKGVRIRSLRNPLKKMSKSVQDPAGTILLSDAPDAAVKKILRAETDTIGVINYDFENQPGISNLLQMLALLTGQTQEAVNDVWLGKERYGELKTAVADVVYQFLSDIQSSLNEISSHDLLSKLEEDESKMGLVAAETLLRVQKAIGIRS